MKNFWLYDPFQAAQLLYGSNREHGNASPINVESPTVFEDYPYFRFAVPRRCRVRAGQWLYVPPCICKEVFAVQGHVNKLCMAINPHSARTLSTIR